MSRRRLQSKEIVTMATLKERGLSNREIAKLLGVSESTVRYRLRRRQEGRPDGRSGKSSVARPYERAIRLWVCTHCPELKENAAQGRPAIPVKVL